MVRACLYFLLNGIFHSLILTYLLTACFLLGLGALGSEQCGVREEQLTKFCQIQLYFLCLQGFQFQMFVCHHLCLRAFHFTPPKKMN